MYGILSTYMLYLNIPKFLSAQSKAEGNDAYMILVATLHKE